jgi:hypothetical protein
MEGLTVSGMDDIRKAWNEGFIDLDIPVSTPGHPTIKPLSYDETVRAFKEEHRKNNRKNNRKFAIKMAIIVAVNIAIHIGIGVLYKKNVIGRNSS